MLLGWFSLAQRRLGADVLEVPRGETVKQVKQFLLKKHTAVNSKKIKLAV